MAMTEPRRSVLVPRLEDLADGGIQLRYDKLSDTLWISLESDPPPAINEWLDDDGAMVRCDPQTGRVVGFEIEGFLRRMLELAGTPRVLAE